MELQLGSVVKMSTKCIFDYYVMPCFYNHRTFIPTLNSTLLGTQKWDVNHLLLCGVYSCWVKADFCLSELHLIFSYSCYLVLRFQLRSVSFLIMFLLWLPNCYRGGEGTRVTKLSYSMSWLPWRTTGW